MRQFTKQITDLVLTLCRATTVRCGPSPRLDRVAFFRATLALPFPRFPLPFVFSSFLLRSHTTFLPRKSAGRSSYLKSRCHGRISFISSCVPNEQARKSVTKRASASKRHQAKEPKRPQASERYEVAKLAMEDVLLGLDDPVQTAAEGVVDVGAKVGWRKVRDLDEGLPTLGEEVVAPVYQAR